MSTTSDPIELSDEEIANKLRQEASHGLRSFRGKTLAPYTAGAKDLVLKSLTPADNLQFHDAVLLYILAELHADRPEERFAKRRSLIVATDDPASFRTLVSMDLVDHLTPADITEARRLVDEILKPVQMAQVTIVSQGPKKKDRAALPPTTGASSPSRSRGHSTRRRKL